MERIVEARAVTGAKQLYDRLSTYDDKTRQDIMADPLLQMIRDIDFEAAQAAIDRKRAEAHG